MVSGNFIHLSVKYPIIVHARPIHGVLVCSGNGLAAHARASGEVGGLASAAPMSSSPACVIRWPRPPPAGRRSARARRRRPSWQRNPRLLPAACLPEEMSMSARREHAPPSCRAAAARARCSMNMAGGAEPRRRGRGRNLGVQKSREENLE